MHEGAQETAGRFNWFHLLGVALLGAYTNAAIYGFQYPAGPDYNFMLPMANWFRDPSLYPADAIRDAYPHVQTFYWQVVALLSRRFQTEHVLLGFFLVTKLIFFGATTRLLAGRVRSRILVACMVMAIALSPLLNGQTPIGGTIILDEISEHAALALAVVLLAGALLIEGKWRSAAVVAALSVYVDALPLLHTLPAFALFAIFDWRAQKRRIVTAAALGAGIVLPWFIHFHRSFLTGYPGDYIAALLINNPLHLTLRWTPASQIAEAALVLLATLCMAWFARRSGLQPERRLELLAASYLIVMSVGVLAGWFWLSPNIARFMLPRADALLLPCAILLLQIYGANFLETRGHRAPFSSCLLAILAILLPLWDWLAIPLILLAAGGLDPRERMERAFAAIFSRFGNPAARISPPRIAAAVCALVIAVSFALSLSSADQLWNCRIPADPEETACEDAQIWAKNHSPRDAMFLVPPQGCGFRVLSERSSWGEWSDGNAMYFYPPFADTFLKRSAAYGPPAVQEGTGVSDSLTELYKNQPWERLSAVAGENKLDYIVQFASTPYSVQPVYANAVFAIYRVR